MKQGYKVIAGPIEHDGVTYKDGETIPADKIKEDQAKALIEAQAVEETTGKEAEKPKEDQAKADNKEDAKKKK